MQPPSRTLLALPLLMQDFSAGDVVFQDPPLAAIQHTANRSGRAAAARATVPCRHAVWSVRPLIDLGCAVIACL